MAGPTTGSNPPMSVRDMRAARAAPVPHLPASVLLGRALVVLGVLALGISAALALFPTNAETVATSAASHTTTVRCGIPLKVLLAHRSTSSAASARQAQAACRKKSDDRVGAALPVGVGGVVLVLAGAAAIVLTRREP